jgi:hypothetical protein
LARKVTRRGTRSGRNTESEKERWLDAKMAAPSSGMFSSPSTHGRKSSLRIGPSTIVFRTQ